MSQPSAPARQSNSQQRMQQQEFQSLTNHPETIDVEDDAEESLTCGGCILP